MAEDKIFFVRLPIAGVISRHIEASDEKEAIEKALADEDKFGPIKMVNGWELDELEVYRHLFEGNVSWVNASDASAEDATDEMDLEEYEEHYK